MKKLENFKIIKLFLIIFTLKILNGNIFNYLNNNYFLLETPFFEKIPENELFFLVVIFAPIFETLIIQFFLYRLLTKLRIENIYIKIIIMSFAFSLAHHYHWLYMVATFVGGLLINYFYVSVLKLRNELQAVFLTMALHASYNLFGFLFVQ